MKDKKDKIYYFQEKSNDVLDLQDELNTEEIGIYFILKAGYFKYSGELKKENANQRCKFFGDINKFNLVIAKLFHEVDGLLINNSWLSEIKAIKDLSKKRKEMAESRWKKETKELKEIEKEKDKDKEIPTDVGTNGVTKTIKQQNNKTLILEQEKIKQQNIENNFNEFWNFYTPVCAKDGTYTNKGSKQKAFKSYIKARNKFDHNKIMDCLKLYLEDCQRRAGYTKHVVSWLNSAIEDNFEYEQVIPIQSQVKPIFQTQEQRDQEIYTNFLKKHGGING